MLKDSIRNSVIVIPGMMGSKLRTSNGRTIWGVFDKKSINPDNEEDVRLLCCLIDGANLSEFDDGLTRDAEFTDNALTCCWKIRRSHLRHDYYSENGQRKQSSTVVGLSRTTDERLWTRIKTELESAFICLHQSLLKGRMVAIKVISRFYSFHQTSIWELRNPTKPKRIVRWHPFKLLAA